MKNETFEIRALMNGYLVEHGYRVIVNPESKDSYDRFEWMNDKYMFATWTEVVDFIKDKPLDVPPAKIVAPIVN